MLIRTTINEMKRILCSSGFWLSVGLALVILFTSQAYKDMDGTVYTVLSAAYQLDTEELVRYGIDAQNLFSMKVRYSLPMYGPLLAALSFAGVLCEEQKYGVRRYLLFREGKMQYVLSKAFSAILASGLSFFMSALVLLLFIYWKYPFWSEVGVDGFQRWLEYYSQKMDGTSILLFEWFGEHAFCMLQLAGVFLYGVFCGFIGFVCTAFFSNVYLAVCIPFFFGYIYYSITEAVAGRLFEGSVSVELYNAINSYVSPGGYIDFWRMRDSLMVNMIVLFAVWTAAVGIHMLRIQKAADCGVNG